MDLPPGFRFHPTDEELITHYLSNKVIDLNFSAVAIAEVDMNKVEPWDLPWKASTGEKEWYFFCVRDKKYPTGLRTNRATVCGYWKATGKDKEIFRGKCLVGMKKTLVFYMGRAPKGVKTNWVSHEYRLEGQLPLQNLNRTTSKNDWVICRVFQKSSGGKKVHISGMIRCNNNNTNSNNNNGVETSSVLSPLTDPSPPCNKDPSSATAGYVHCFSNFVTKQQEMMMMNNLNMINNLNYIGNSYSPAAIPPSFAPWSPPPPPQPQMQASFPGADPAVLRNWLMSCGAPPQSFKTEEMVTASQETGLSTDINTEISSVPAGGPQDLDCLWIY